MSQSRILRIARLHVERGDPIPLDIYAQLIESGIDPTELYRQHRPQEELPHAERH